MEAEAVVIRPGKLNTFNIRIKVRNIENSGFR